MDDRVDDLTARAAAGDEAAAHELLAAHLPGLEAYIRLRAGLQLLERESCSDLAQSVCRDVLEGLHRFRHAGEHSFRRWLFTTASRKLADRHAYWHAGRRDVAREAPAPADSAAEQARLAAFYASLTPSRAAIAREEVDRFEAAFASLPEDHRQVILLCRVLGLSAAEAGAETGRSPGAVRTMLYRAMASLAERLDDGERLR